MFLQPDDNVIKPKGIQNKIFTAVETLHMEHAVTVLLQSELVESLNT